MALPCGTSDTPSSPGLDGLTRAACLWGFVRPVQSPPGESASVAAGLAGGSAPTQAPVGGEERFPAENLPRPHDNGIPLPTQTTGGGSDAGGSGRSGERGGPLYAGLLTNQGQIWHVPAGTVPPDEDIVSSQENASRVFRPPRG